MEGVKVINVTGGLPGTTMVEKPHVGVPGQRAAIEPSNNHKLGQHLTATKPELLSCSFPKFLTRNSEGEKGCVRPPSPGMICDAALVTRPNYLFPWCFNSRLSLNALRLEFSLAK